MIVNCTKLHFTSLDTTKTLTITAYPSPYKKKNTLLTHYNTLHLHKNPTQLHTCNTTSMASTATEVLHN